MKRILMALVVMAPVGLWLMYAFNTEVIRYRLAIDIQTPSGLRSGSGVIEVRYVNEPVPGFGMRQQAYVRGEAVAVDLDGGKTLFALLASGPRGDGVDWPRYVRRHTVPLHPKPGPGLAGELKAPDRPTIVAFGDINDPATARVVFADAARGDGIDNLAAALGPGHALGAVTVTYVDPGRWITGVWPFSLIAAPWPRWLFGTPITRGIEKRLPWYGVPFDQRRNPDGSKLTNEQIRKLQNMPGPFKSDF